MSFVRIAVIGLMIASCVTAISACSVRTSRVEPVADAAIPAAPALGFAIERFGRPLTGNALIGPLATDTASDARKDQYNRASRKKWPQFAADLAATLALYDGFDGVCGNQWKSAKPATTRRYSELATLLADDRLWIDSEAKMCGAFLAVELAGDGRSAVCGGRTLEADAGDVLRSLWVGGTVGGFTDGVDVDDRAHTSRTFPFLAPP